MSKKKPEKLEPMNYAVIIVNNSTSYLRPIQNQKSHCLIPLVNVPILHYTMLKLLYGNFRNFIIFCSSHEIELKDFLNTMNYSDFVDEAIKIDIRYRQCNITPVEAIRILDNEKFENDFLLLNGDVVTDCNLEQLTQKLIELKKKSEKANNAIILTKLLTTKLPDQLKRFSKRCGVLEIDSDSSVILGQDGFRVESIDKCENLKKFHDNLLDPEVYFCSKFILPRSQEHSEVRNMDGLLDSVLSHQHLTDQAMSVMIVDNLCYRVNNLETYMYVSQCLIRCSVVGLSPKSLFGDNIRLVGSSNRIITTHSSSYISSKLPPDIIDLAASSFVGNVQVLEGSEIGENCRLIDCIVGRNCRIGSSVILQRCTLMDDVKMDDRSMIVDGFVCSGARIKGGVQLTGKCLVDFGFVVEEGIKASGKIFSYEEQKNYWLEEYEQLFDREFEEVKVGAEDEDSNDENFHNDDDAVTEIINLMTECMSNDEKLEIFHTLLNRVRMESDSIKTTEDICVLLGQALVEYPIRYSDCREYEVQFEDVIKKLNKSIRRIITSDSLVDSFIETIKDTLVEKITFLPKLSLLLYQLYMNDIASRSQILAWYSAFVKRPEEEQAQEIQTNLAKFIDFLNDESSDGDSDDESNEEEDNSD